MNYFTSVNNTTILRPRKKPFYKAALSELTKKVSDIRGTVTREKRGKNCESRTYCVRWELAALYHGLAGNRPFSFVDFVFSIQIM